MRRIVESIFNSSNSESETITGLWSRQSGKSESLACLASALCIIMPALAKEFPDDERLTMYKEGFWIGIFAPKQQQSTIIYERIRQRAEKESSQEIYSDPSLGIGVAMSRGDQVSWTNGSYVVAQTASEQSNVEGKTYHLVIIDEAQVVSEVKINKEIRPMCAATNGSMVMIGTANSLRGNFRKTILQNLEREKQTGVKNHFEFPYEIVILEKRRTFNRTQDKKHLAYEKWVAGELRRLGGNKENEEFRQNFRLLWQEANLCAIDPESFYAAADLHRDVVERAYYRRFVAGLDYGKKRDVTVLTIAEVDETPIMDARSLIRPGDEQPLFYNKTIVAWYEIPGRKWHDILASVVVACECYSIDTIVADGTGIGDPLSEQLQNLIPSIRVVPFIMNHVGNDKAYKLYIQEIEAGRMRYVAGDETQKLNEYHNFVHEHEELLKDKVGVYLRCSAPEGEHDDYCDSGALCCWAAAQPRYDDGVTATDNPMYERRGRLGGGARADRYRRAA